MYLHTWLWTFSEAFGITIRLLPYYINKEKIHGFLRIRKRYIYYLDQNKNHKTFVFSKFYKKKKIVDLIFIERQRRWDVWSSSCTWSGSRTRDNGWRRADGSRSPSGTRRRCRSSADGPRPRRRRNYRVFRPSFVRQNLNLLKVFFFTRRWAIANKSTDETIDILFNETFSSDVESIAVSKKLNSFLNKQLT